MDKNATPPSTRKRTNVAPSWESGRGVTMGQQLGVGTSGYHMTGPNPK